MKRASILVGILVLIACDVSAQQPVNWCKELMQGFPPSPEKQVTTTSGHRHWLRYPNTTWSYQHTRELLPTRPVARGATVAELQKDLKELDNLSFDDGNGKQTTFGDFTRGPYTDAIIVLHDGKIVWEHYDKKKCMKQESHHLLFSASKSFVGLVAAIMVWQKEIEENAPISQYVPELAASAYGDATVRQVMDMRVGVKFSETYTKDPHSDINRYLAAAGWIPNPLCQGPSNLYEALWNLKDYEGPHGGPFDSSKSYKSPNADVLAWVVSKVSGKSLSELVSELIWSKIGAEQDAHYLVDAVGKEAAFGGLNVTLRDFARFGEMMRQKGDWPEQRVVPSDVIADITKGGGPALPSWSYRSQWWRMNNPNGAYMARGVYGQRLYIDPKAKLVVAKFGSAPDPNPKLTDTYHQYAFDALATHLQNEK